VRRREYNGLDWIDVSDDQRTLTVQFLGPAPEGLTPEHFRIAGGRRIRGIRVTGVERCASPDPEIDGCLKVTVDRPGDFSIYELCLVDPPEELRFDPRYRCLEFSFKASCPSDLDCAEPPVCVPEADPTPEFSYLAKDYASFRRLILDRLAVTVPAWRERHVPDIGITLVELLAYVGDYLSYEQDAVATEAYLATARQRISVRRHARLVDYRMHEGCNARTWVHVNASADVTVAAQALAFLTRFDRAPRVDGRVLQWDDLREVPAGAFEVFEPLVEDPGGLLEFRSAHNEIRFWTWGDAECCLVAGSTSATLVDGWVTEAPSVPEYEEPAGESPAAGESGEPGESEESGDVDSPDGESGPNEVVNEGSDETGTAGSAAAPRVHITVGPGAGLPPTRPEVSVPPSSSGFPRSGAAPLPEASASASVEPPRRMLTLKVGDVLIFEEVIGPRTGSAADADPGHRHAVRLTRVEPVIDELYDQPLLEVEWASADALPFPLCLSVIGPAPECALLRDVSVARGNVVLADHGRRVHEPESLGCVPVEPVDPCCEREGRPADPVRRGGKFRPVLREPSLTFSARLRAEAPATGLLDQDPRAALPWIRLSSGPDGECGAELPTEAPAREWAARPDLLASSGEDDHYVVELDDRRRAHLRFGDGELGRRPEPGVAFRAWYRVGNGPAGNTGADTLTIAVTDELLSGVTLDPRNPFPARGGTVPEPVADVRLFAPHAYRQLRERAVTAADYAELAERHPGVQRAAAELRWNGSWYEARVAIDPAGGTAVPAKLLDSVRRHLFRYRRIGHDLAVTAAAWVPLDINLEVCVDRAFLRGHVKSALRQRFSTGRMPDGSFGYFHPDSLTFGLGISLSRLVAAAQAVPGVSSVSITRLERLFEGPNGEIEKGFLPIGALEIARVDNDPDFPENGRISFEMRGGR